MAIKTNGAEWKAYYSDRTVWPEGAYHEDVLLRVDGKEVGNEDGIDLGELPDEAQITILDGYLVGVKPDTLTAHFTAWRSKRARTIIVAEVPNDLVEAVRAAIKAAGGKLV